MSTFEIYQQYLKKYNKDPTTATNLIKFSKSLNKPLSFKDAKKFMFDLVSGKYENQKNENEPTSHNITKPKLETTQHKNKPKNRVLSDTTNSDINQLKNTINELQNKINLLNKQINSLNIENKSLKNDINAKNLELTTKDVKINELNIEINKLKNNLTTTPSKSKNSVELNDNIEHSLNDISNKFKPKKKKKKIYIPPSPTQYVKQFPPPSQPPPTTSTSANDVLNIMQQQSQSQKLIYNPRQAFTSQRHGSMPILYQNGMNPTMNQQNPMMFNNVPPFNWQQPPPMYRPQSQTFLPPPVPPPIMNNINNHQSTSLPNVLEYNGMQSRKSNDEIIKLKNYNQGIPNQTQKHKKKKKK